LQGASAQPRTPNRKSKIENPSPTILLEVQSINELEWMPRLPKPELQASEFGR
jgi:hypothetical protein